MGVLSSTWGALWLAQDTRTSAALVPNRWLQGAEPLYSKICYCTSCRLAMAMAMVGRDGPPRVPGAVEEVGRGGPPRRPERRRGGAPAGGCLDRGGSSALTGEETAAASGVRKKAGAGAAISVAVLGIEERKAAGWILPEGREGGAESGYLGARWILESDGRGGWRRGEGRWEGSESAREIGRAHV